MSATSSHRLIAAGGFAGFLFLALAATACSSSESPARAPDPASQKDAAPVADGAGTVVDAGGAAEAAAAPTTCASLRNCITACVHEASCEQQCLGRATAAARMSYAKVTTCSQKSCAPDDDGCRCPLECNADGACLIETDLCRDLEDDQYCDINCR
jgi:hypothetical protein